MKTAIRAFVLVLILSFSAQAEDIRIVTEPWAPYTYGEGTEIKGVVTEIVRATMERSGLSYTIAVYPWARAYDMAMTEENVLIYSIFKLPNRADKFKWIKIDGLSINMYLFRPKYRTDIMVTTVEDAKAYKVGVTRETSTHHFLLSQGFVENKNLFPVNSEEQNALKSSPRTMRIDLTTGDRLSLAHWLDEAGLPSDYWVALAPLFHEDFYMAFGTKTSDEVVEKVRCAFREIKEEGQLDAIVDKYYRMFESQSDSTE